MMKTVSFTLVELILVSGIALAQVPPFSVGLGVTADSTGVVERAFRSALLSLGDVEVVSLSEPHDFTVRVVATCERSACASYSVATLLAVPLDETGLNISIPDRSWIELPPDLEGFIRPRGYWVALWGEAVLRREVADLVATIDTQCLKPFRLRARALSLDTDSVVADSLALELREGDWLCMPRLG